MDGKPVLLELFCMLPKGIKMQITFLHTSFKKKVKSRLFSKVVMLRPLLESMTGPVSYLAHSMC